VVDGRHGRTGLAQRKALMTLVIPGVVSRIVRIANRRSSRAWRDATCGATARRSI
jgi:hypothetical protein